MAAHEPDAVIEGLQLRHAREGRCRAAGARSTSRAQGRGGLVAGWTRPSNKACSTPWAMTPDVNVLVAASRADHPTMPCPRLARRGHHRIRRRRSLHTDADGADQLPAARHKPEDLSPGHADRGCDCLRRRAVGIARRATGDAGPGGPRLRQLCLDKQSGGNDVPDAWLSARGGAPRRAPGQFRSGLQEAARPRSVHVNSRPCDRVQGSGGQDLGGLWVSSTAKGPHPAGRPARHSPTAPDCECPV